MKLKTGIGIGVIAVIIIAAIGVGCIYYKENKITDENHPPKILWAYPRDELVYLNPYPTRFVVVVWDKDNDSMLLWFAYRLNSSDEWIHLESDFGPNGVYSTEIPYPEFITATDGFSCQWKVYVSDGEDSVTGLYNFSFP